MKQSLLFFLVLILSLSLRAEELICPSSVADPAIVQMNKKILVMGTGNNLEWDSLADLVKTGKPSEQKLSLYQEVLINGEKEIVSLNPEELPWDLQFYQIRGKRYLYGGVMTPFKGERHAHWPDDNISRRIKVAVYDSTLKGWVFKSTPVFGVPSHTDWAGHSYGQQIIRTHSGLYLMHEEISRPGVTEIFIRKLLTPFKAGSAKKLIGVDDLPPEASRRHDGGQLLEGPRYQLIHSGGKKIHLIFFSTGDFPTNNYATRVAYSEHSALGPYRVVNKNVTEKFGAINQLYGVGRAFPFTYKKKHWLLFHGAKNLRGVDHSLWPTDLKSFKRCLFLSPVSYEFSSKTLDVSLSEK